MPSLKKTAEDQDQTEQDFIDALDRLKEGEPKHKALKSLKAKGTLKINVANVALEAGHSRTLIGLKTGCRYPRVRELILQAKSGRDALPTTLRAVIDQLRANNLDLTLQVKTHKAAG